jgi:hypothetical protein
LNELFLFSFKTTNYLPINLANNFAYKKCQIRNNQIISIFTYQSHLLTNALIMKSYQIFSDPCIKRSTINLLNTGTLNFLNGTLKTICIVTLIFCSTQLSAQNSENTGEAEEAFEEVKIGNPLSTGKTTGQIGAIPVTNNSDNPISIKAQTAIIFSNRGWQGFFSRIPGQTIQPGQTISVPVTGYCTDVHKPPPPAGTSLPSIDTWIPVRDSLIPEGTGPDEFILVTGKEMEPFSPDDIPIIIALPGYTKKKQNPDDPFIITWPGTDSLVYGTFDISKNEKEIAPLIVNVVIRIEKATIEMVSDSLINTPFSNDGDREKETIIQQTLWRYMADLTGEKYDKDDFSERIISQYEENTETKIEDAPVETVARLEKGVDDFWGAFELVGAKAKVFKAQTVAAFEYDKVKKKEDFKGLSRKRYDDYSSERALKGLSHKKACKVLGVDPDGPFGKALARAYANE